VRGVLYVGDDWAEDHHDIEVQDEDGRRLVKARFAEGIEGLTRLHELLAEHLEENEVDPVTGLVSGQVVLGIETDRGAWVSALVAAGYQVHAINPMSVARYRERHSPRARSPTARTRTCWPRSCASTVPITGRWPVTALRSRR